MPTRGDDLIYRYPSIICHETNDGEDDESGIETRATIHQGNNDGMPVKKVRVCINQVVAEYFTDYYSRFKTAT